MSTPIATGGSAPDFTLLNGYARPVRLRDYRGRNVVLAFYPADWSPVCGNELSLFQEVLSSIESYNAQLLGISVDGVFSHRAWAESRGITFPLLSDFWPHGAVAQAYGVFRNDDGICERALFFIDETGVLRDSWVAELPGIAPGVNLVFEALETMHPQARIESQHA